MRPTSLRMGALVATGVFALAASTPADASSGQRIRLLDDCEVESFEAALGAGACVGDGGTEFDELIEELEEDGEHNKWATNPEKTHIEHGESLRVVNKGGEVHSFTHVKGFGAGCVPELNAILGLDGPPVSDCSQVRILFHNDHMKVHRLKPGKHRFQCMVHPWMHTTVKVRR